MTLGIFSYADAPTARGLVEAARRLDPPGGVEVFDLALTAGEPAAIEGGVPSWRGVRLDGLTAAFIHGFAWQNPVVPSLPGQVDWTLWHAGYLADQQRFSFLYSLFRRLEAGGVRMVNSPESLLTVYGLAGTLALLRQAGVPVPDFLCTNDDAAVAAFVARHRTVVWRTAVGRCAWQLFLDKQRRALIAPQSPPVMLADVKPGPLHRAYMLAGWPAVVLAMASPLDRPLERLELFRAIPAAGEWIEDLATAAATVGAAWCMIQFIPVDGRACVYAIDVDPVVSDLPAEIATPLLETLAAWMADPASAPVGIGTDGNNDTDNDNRVHPRRPLFLRRMLRTLFEIQNIKYGELDPPATPKP